jgi:hypothetical protein
LHEQITRLPFRLTGAFGGRGAIQATKASVLPVSMHWKVCRADRN